MPNPDSQYIVIREWKSEKRTNRFAAGPFATRARATAFMRRHLHMNVYDSQLYVVPLRKPV